MEDWREEIWERANLFAAENGLSLIGQLGYRYDRNVFATERQSAIKVLRFQRLHERERDVYLRLQTRSIVEVAGFSVPQLFHDDDRLWVVEMGSLIAKLELSQRPARSLTNPLVVEVRRDSLLKAFDEGGVFGQKLYEGEVVDLDIWKYVDWAKDP